MRIFLLLIQLLFLNAVQANENKVSIAAAPNFLTTQFALLPTSPLQHESISWNMLISEESENDTEDEERFTTKNAGNLIHSKQYPTQLIAILPLFLAHNFLPITSIPLAESATSTSLVYSGFTSALRI